MLLQSSILIDFGDSMIAAGWASQRAVSLVGWFLRRRAPSRRQNISAKK